MTNVKARLLEAATTLRRTIYQSLPWGQRVGSLLFNLRFAADPASFGKFAYGMFWLLGIEGLPRTPVLPATIKDIDRLPRGYGHDFGIRAQAVARKYLHDDEDAVEEVLSVVALKLATSESIRRAIADKRIRDAENYVLRTVQNQTLDYLRSNKVRRHQEISEMIEEPASWQDLAELIPEREQEGIREELERAMGPRLHRELPLYFDLLMDGFSNQQIANDRMLPSLQSQPMSQQALSKYRDRLKAVLRNHFSVVAMGESRTPMPQRAHEAIPRLFV